jgi:hypothetical protein
VPIRLERIAPAERRRRKHTRPRRRGTDFSGTLVVTNDYALAHEACSYSPDFTETRPHEFDRALME